MGTATQVQILDDNFYISHSASTFGKGINPIILPPAMGTIAGREIKWIHVFPKDLN